MANFKKGQEVWAIEENPGIKHVLGPYVIAAKTPSKKEPIYLCHLVDDARAHTHLLEENLFDSWQAAGDAVWEQAEEGAEQEKSDA